MRRRWRCWGGLLIWAMMWLGHTQVAHAQKAKKFVFSPEAYKKAMTKAVGLYRQKTWAKALPAFRAVLKTLRKQPAYKKAPTYLYIGLCLFHNKEKGLAWKAFEQALYSNSNISLPKGESGAVDNFFRDVKTRVLRRGGPSPVKGGAAAPIGGGGSGSILTWALVAVAGIGIAGGSLWLVNSINMQSEADKWLEAATQKEPERKETFDKMAETLKASSGWQTGAAIGALAVGALAAVGAIVVYIVIDRPKAASASLPPPPSRSTQLAHFQ